MLWNFPCFSFLKNVSGIQTFELSVIVRYLIFPPISSYSSLLSYHCCRKVIWTLNSILTSSIFSKLLINREPVTTVGAPKSSELLLAPWNKLIWNITKTSNTTCGTIFNFFHIRDSRHPPFYLVNLPKIGWLSSCQGLDVHSKSKCNLSIR